MNLVASVTTTITKPYKWKSLSAGGFFLCESVEIRENAITSIKSVTTDWFI
ncbi:MAG: hypothetical protein IH623_03280 [Verrucomicrobia bacterium]|nr:hypothetical protein [Verrucomicrobiota bacterium]